MKLWLDTEPGGPRRPILSIIRLILILAVLGGLIALVIVR